MSIKYYYFATPKFLLFRNQFKRLDIPQYPVFIPAVHALVILCGRSGLRPTLERCET
jgi:hypothetical protein